MTALAISEQFYSIQGEGFSMGQPSVFLRLKGCNLRCGGYNTLQTGLPEAAASWRCDTIEVWTQGHAWLPERILTHWQQQHWDQALAAGAHLIITGGEPLLQDAALCTFLATLKAAYTSLPYIEIETNGTLRPSPLLDTYISQYNVSPKTACSGMKHSDFFSADSLAFFAQSQTGFFKFVIATEQDINDVFDTYITPFKLPQKRVCFMPAASARADLLTLEPLLINWCKERGIRYSTRLHIALWDKKTGV